MCRTTATLVAVALSTACASAGTAVGTSTSPADAPAAVEPAATPPGTPAVVSAPARTPSIAELEALYRARSDSALTRFSEADVHFMTAMISHHAQALQMAGLASTRGASRSVQILTARTISAQSDEINLMQQWLRDRGQPVPEIYTDGVGSRVRIPEGGMLMPGMLTPEQMAELEAARGAEYDRLFLTYMIQHHRGAVTMVQDLFATDGAALGDVVFKLASDIQADQITEIARMRRMLEESFPAGRRP